jgi:hypothetical protein
MMRDPDITRTEDVQIPSRSGFRIRYVLLYERRLDRSFYMGRCDLRSGPSVHAPKQADVYWVRVT